MDLQSLVKKGNSPSPLQIIMMVIFILPAIIHGFKWGWIYPILAFFAFLLLLDLGALGIVLGIPVAAGSIWLCRHRFLKMREQRGGRSTLNPHTPTGMRDYD